MRPYHQNIYKQNAGEDVEKRGSSCTVGGNVNWSSQSVWKTVWRFLKKKLGIKPLYDPAIPLLGIYPEEIKTEKDACTPTFTAALLTTSRAGKEPRCPSTDEWVKKLWYIYSMEYYSAIKRNTLESVLMRWIN